MALTILQKSNDSGFPKPKELIEITGAHGLEASDRAILNLLYQHAQDGGLSTDTVGEWEIALASLRPSKHESNDRLRESLDRLMQVIVNVPYVSRDGEARTLKTHLFDFFDLPDAETGAAAVKFGVPHRLRPILARSNRWGRIKAEVVCAMSSRYAIALYEMVQLRANMDRCVEVFSVDRFRDLLGVPPGTYERGNDFVRFVLQPAELEVNGLSDMGVKLEPRRRSTRAPIESVAATWWPKQGDEFRATYKERQRSKLGRTARLRGLVEAVAVPDAVS